MAMNVGATRLHRARYRDKPGSEQYNPLNLVGKTPLQRFHTHGLVSRPPPRRCAKAPYVDPNLKIERNCT